MRYVEGIDSFVASAAGTVITIGNFDGVHIGHQALLQECCNAARGGESVVAVTFDPHPIEILAPTRTPPKLTTLAERVALLRMAGADQVVAHRTDAALLDRTARDFLEWVAMRLRPRAIVEGPTFNFGRDRAGDVNTLREHAARLGYQAIVLDERRCDAIQDRPQVNSSAIRAAIRGGEVDKAMRMLGRAHRLVGRVGHGHHRGVTIGFPTANLEQIAQMLPAEGVYAAIAQTADARDFLAAVNFGPQPTFEQPTPRVEAHLLDFSGDLRGQLLGVKLLKRLRGQVRFNGVEELISQLKRDVEATRALRDEFAAERERVSLPLDP